MLRKIDITLNKSRLHIFVQRMMELGIYTFDVRAAINKENFLKGISEFMMMVDPPFTVTIYMVKPEDEADAILDQLHKVAMPETLIDYFSIQPCYN